MAIKIADECMYLLSNYFEVFLNSLESIFCKCKRAVQLHYLQKLSTHYMHRKVYNYKQRTVQYAMAFPNENHSDNVTTILVLFEAHRPTIMVYKLRFVFKG